MIFLSLLHHRQLFIVELHHRKLAISCRVTSQVATCRVTSCDDISFITTSLTTIFYRVTSQIAIFWKQSYIINYYDCRSMSQAANSCGVKLQAAVPVELVRAMKKPIFIEYIMDCYFLQSFVITGYFLQSYIMDCYFLQSFVMTGYFLQSYIMDCYFRQSWVDKRLSFSGYKVTAPFYSTFCVLQDCALKENV